jgi:hypothetical protein
LAAGDCTRSQIRGATNSFCLRSPTGTRAEALARAERRKTQLDTTPHRCLPPAHATAFSGHDAAGDMRHLKPAKREGGRRERVRRRRRRELPVPNRLPLAIERVTSGARCRWVSLAVSHQGSLSGRRGGPPAAPRHGPALRCFCTWPAASSTDSEFNQSLRFLSPSQFTRKRKVLSRCSFILYIYIRPKPKKPSSLKSCDSNLGKQCVAKSSARFR